MLEKSTIIKDLEDRGGRYSLVNKYKHPSITPLINRSVDGRNYFDLDKTAEAILSTINFVEECGKKGKVMLFVSTRRESVGIVEKAAKELSMPYMLNRWIGGTLSNFENIRTRVDRMLQLKSDKENDKWSQFTKKEKILLDRELRKLESMFAGVIDLKQLPGVVFILDVKKNSIALIEALNTKIPVISLSNADASLQGLEHQITTNINSRENVTYIMNLLQEAYMKGVGNKEDK